MEQLIRERLWVVVKGKKTDVMIDVLADKFRTKLSDNDDIDTIDLVIKRDFTQVRQEILKDLQSRKSELDIFQKDNQDKLCSANKMLENLMQSPVGADFISADDMLAKMQAKDVLTDADYRSFESILRNNFDNHAKSYWDDQIQSCLSAAEKAQTKQDHYQT